MMPTNAAKVKPARLPQRPIARDAGTLQVVTAINCRASGSVASALFSASSSPISADTVISRDAQMNR